MTPPPAIQRTEATPEAIKAAGERLQRLAQIQRKMRAGLTFEEFEETVYREPFEGGKYIVNGDTPIANRKLLREFYEKRVKPPLAKPSLVTGLAVATTAGMDISGTSRQDEADLLRQHGVRLAARQRRPADGERDRRLGEGGGSELRPRR